MLNPRYRLFDPEVLADPYALYKTIRENTPIYFDDTAGFWVVTRYQYVADLLRHPDIGSDRIESLWLTNSWPGYPKRVLKIIKIA